MFLYRVPSPRSRVVLAVATALLAVSSPAEAQLGKLKKMGADLAKDAAKEKIDGKKETPAKPGSTGSSSGSVSSRNAELTLDEDRVALVVASLQPMVADAERRRELRIVREQHEQKVAAMQACASAAQARASSMPPMTLAERMQQNEAALNRLTKEIEGLTQRLSTAISANDTRKRIYITDSVSVAQSRMALLAVGANCAVEYTPSLVLEEQVRSESRTVASDNMDDGAFNPPAVVKENLTPYQYGLLRERIALWALKQENPSLKVGKQGTFTPEEEAALQANASDIRKLTPLFKDGSLRWSSWGDLGRW